MAALTTPPDLKTQLDRGRKPMRRDAPKRRLCTRFTKGDTYCYLNSKNVLTQQSTVTDLVNNGGKPLHRVRNTYNFIKPIVEAKASAATQRIPSYEVTPTSTDFQALSAADLAQRVALYGYDEWNLRDVALRTVLLAIGGGGAGFALPYFDPDVGPYTQMPDGPDGTPGEWVGQGEVKVLVLNGNQVYWENGVPFLDAKWYAIERARSIEDAKAIPGFIPGTQLTPDATTSDIPHDRDAVENMVIVTEYFERPSAKRPQGRCVVIANGRPIVDYRLIDPTSVDWWGPYPLQDADGTVLDEPLLHRLVWTHDADSDQDFGLTWQLIDFERTIQDGVNKLVEWKNRCLNPQMKAPVGSLVSNPTDIPGDVRFYRPIGGLQPEWEQPPPIPAELFELVNWAIQAMQSVAAHQQPEPAPNLAAKTLEASIEQSENQWQSFLGDVAEWHSRLMRHCLVLVARYYTEPRLLGLRGRDSWDSPQDFRGAQLMGQTQVRVLPQSIIPVTRSGVQDQLTWINTNWPGWLQPEAALAALQAGSLDRLTQSYFLDVGRANMVLSKITDGTVMDMPMRSDTMPDGTTMEAPSYMPGPADNLNVWKSEFSDFMKSDAFQRLDPAMQEVTNQVWAGIQYLEAQKAQAQLEQQNAVAVSQGSLNAAKPQVKGQPSLPGSSTVPLARQ